MFVLPLQVREARPLLEDVEAERMFPPEQLVKEAITATEQDGIVFIDEVGGQRGAQQSAYLHISAGVLRQR